MRRNSIFFIFILSFTITHFLRFQSHAARPEKYPSKNHHMEDMKLHFVLVHGASHGGWCWYKIRALLEAAGHNITSLDLKCSGIDPSDFNTVFDFHDYNQPLTSFMSALPPDEKVILVGHSIGGLSLTDAIRKFPEKIHLAIYVAGAMLKYGNSSSDHDSNATSEPGQQSAFDNFDLIYGLGRDQPPTGMILKPQLRRTLLYNRSPIEDNTLASMLLRPAPARALINARLDGGEGADMVKRVFIRTMEDKLLSKDSQDYMIKQWPPSQVFELDSDHSPFFSAPLGLFQILVEATSSI